VLFCLIFLGAGEAFEKLNDKFGTAHREICLVAHLILQPVGFFLLPALCNWPAPGSEDTELGVLMELEVGHGETEVYAGVQA
jgi:hypothetical protein